MNLNSNSYPVPATPVANVTGSSIAGKKTKKSRGRKAKTKKTSFWIILAQNHDAVKFGANYKFRRFKTEREAKTIARIMTIKHKVQFHVLKTVCAYKPVPGTEAIKV